jgi:GNAT superfamily N-acetyltransferase
LTLPAGWGDSRRITWRIETTPDAAREDEITERLVDHNKAASSLVRMRFEPDNLRTAGRGVRRRAGWCAGRRVHRPHRGRLGPADDRHAVGAARRRVEGIGRALLAAVEEQARGRGCRWAKLNTWEFQAPGFYERCGYEEYGREVDYPPGHVNHLMRKDL